MSKTYTLDMDQHQIRLLGETLDCYICAHMDIATCHPTSQATPELIHDCLAIRRLLNQIKSQYENYYPAENLSLYEEKTKRNCSCL
jgi:hypothetical protein